MNFFRRERPAAQDAEGQTVEMGPPNLPALVETQQTSAWGFRRPNFLVRRNRDDAEEPAERPPQHVTDNPDDSPKTPRFPFTALPGHRLHLPWSRGENGEDVPNRDGDRTTTDGRSVGQQSDDLDTRPLPAIPPPTAPGLSEVQGGPRRFSGPDPAELRLAQLADDGRRRRGSRGSRRSGGSRGLRLGRLEYVQPGNRPKRFLFCFPWVESRRTRMLILQSFVSGLFSATLLGTYLALSLTGSIATSEFSILLILIILISAAFFCHSVIRLFIYFYRPPPNEGERPGVQRIGGYAVPEEPIRVILARDEEDIEEANDGPAANKPKPPPYGAWRQSIRVDPNRIYWQRTDAQESPAPGRNPEVTTGPRPPSYISEDGVDYVVEARPRSMAPTAYGAQVVEVPAPLPVHPSEVGRWNEQQAPWRN